MSGNAPRLFTGGQLDSDYNCTVIVQTNGVLALWPIRFYLISVFKILYLSLLRINVCGEDLTVLTHFDN